MTDSRENHTDGSASHDIPNPDARTPETAAPAPAAPSASDAPQPPQAPPGPPAPPTQPSSDAGRPASDARPSSYAPPVPGTSAFPAPEQRATGGPVGAAAQHPHPGYAHSAPQQAPHQYGPPQQGTPQQGAAQYGAPQQGAGYAFGRNPYERESTPAATAQHPGAAQNTDGAARDGKPGRRAPLGLVAALAVGALIGGVSAAGVTAVALNANRGEQVSSSAASPANVTVNDAEDATVITGVAASAGPSVVTISVADASGQAAGTGSGVILSEDGYVLTNTHVVTLDGATGDASVSVQTSDGRLYQAEIVGTDPVSDLAVIRIDAEGDFAPIEFADSDDLNVGDTAVAIGAPLGLANTVTNGIVSSLNRSITVASSAAPETPGEEAPDPDDNGGDGPFDFWQFGTPDGQSQTPTQATSTIALSVIQTDAAINPGNSGGALLDAEGRLIGINVAIASAGQGQQQSAAGSIGVGFAIPSNLAERISSEIIANGTGSHGLLGASVNDVTDADATVVGAAIEEVTPGGAAQTAGLRAGDVVTKVDDIPITGRTDLTAQIRALAGGSDTTLTYVRDGRVDTVDVTLGDLAAQG